MNRLQRVATLTIILTLGAAAALACDPLLLQEWRNPPTTEEVVRWRIAGAAGLDELRARFASDIAAAVSDGPSAEEYRRSSRWAAISAAIDAVAAQKDAHVSGLFWHTDFAAAAEEARRSGRPILTLRLLGRLDEELSCANSRFLRTTIYADPEVARQLRSEFVLHWKSVRPVPRVTIDFGDGRMLERTLTGNSIQYAVTPDGTVIDALPGLVDRESMLTFLANARSLHRANPDSWGAYASSGAIFESQLAHALRLWRDRLNATLDPVSPQPPMQLVRHVRLSADGRAAAGVLAPDALAAVPIAVTKSRVERVPLEQLTRRAERVRAESDAATWRIAGQLHAPAVTVAPECERLMRTKCGGVGDFDAKLARFRAALAQDTVYNLAALRPVILGWLASAKRPTNVDELNRRVYAELFLTPDSDPWLGLAAADDFTALPEEGVRIAATK